jgi:two-component system, sensor histidine kinase and response regulator
LENYLSYEELEKRLKLYEEEILKLREENEKLKGLGFSEERKREKQNKTGRRVRNKENELAHLITENFPFPFSLKNIEGKLICVNSHYARKINLSKWQIIGKFEKDLFSEELALKWEKEDNEIMQSGRPALIEGKIDTKWYEIYKAPVYDARGSLLGLMNLERDITTQQNRLFNLSSEVNYFDTLMELLPFAVSYKDTSCLYTRMNMKHARLFGINTPEEALGKSDFDFMTYDHAYQILEQEKNIILTGEPLLQKIEKYRKTDGSLVLLECTKCAMRDRNGKITGLCCISVKIDNEREFSSPLTGFRETAKTFTGLDFAMLDRLSQKIRNPLNGILGFSNLLKYDDLSASTRKQYLYYIQESGYVLQGIIDDIFDMARLEAGRISLKENKFFVDELLQTLFDSFLSSLKKEGKNTIELRMKPYLHLTESVVISDERRLHQILNNLLSNAIKYTEHGYIEFGCETKKSVVVEEGKENAWLDFFVEDTGLGVDADKLNFVFQSSGNFFDDKVIKLKGSGIGLSLVKKLLDLFKGHIWVESTIGKGSLFHFSIPVQIINIPYNQCET